MTNFRHSEVLCYVQNNFAKFAHANIATCLNGFYSNDEILEAKNVLFSVADEIKPADFEIKLRKILRRGEEAVRRQADVTDLLTLWAELDAAKLIMPVFMAADLSRLPPLVMADTDLCTMNVAMFDLKNMLTSVIATQTQMAEKIQALEANQSVQKTSCQIVPSESTSASADITASFPPLAASFIPSAIPSGGVMKITAGLILLRCQLNRK